MPAWATRCGHNGCKGVPFAVQNHDGAARISEAFFGRLVYECDTCHTRFSVDPKKYLEQTDKMLHPNKRVRSFTR